MSLGPLVGLYRLCNRPDLNGGTRINSTAPYRDAKPYLEEIASGTLGHLEEIIVDGNEYAVTELPNSGEHLEFSLALPAMSNVRFYSNIGELLRLDKKVSRGVIPAEYYIVESDYYSNDVDVPVPASLEVLSRVCRLISGLSELAHYHDEKLGGGYLKLVFIRSEAISDLRPIEIETKITESIIEAAKSLNVRLVDELSQSTAANDPHYSAKVGVFGTSLAEFVAGKGVGNSFDYLVSHWDEFVRGYQRDLSTYLSGFAFHKAKVEVVEAELKIANEFSKVLNDILGKLLGIPVSLAAVFAIEKNDGLLKQLFVVFGVLIACLILSRVVGNQFRQFKRVDNAKDILIGAIEGKKESYPEDLKKEVDGLSLALKENSEFLRNTLYFFRTLCWLPLFVVFVYFVYINCEEFLRCLLGLSCLLGGEVEF